MRSSTMNGVAKLQRQWAVLYVRRREIIIPAQRANDQLLCESVQRLLNSIVNTSDLPLDHKAKVDGESERCLDENLKI